MLYIVRGLPGSGKSTLAKRLQTSLLNCDHYEADEFFMNSDGQYNFDPAFLGTAHRWCQDKVLSSFIKGNDVIVSNTFTTYKEMKYYLGLAHQFQTDVQIITCQGNFGSIHNVPDETIQRMKDRWQEVVYDEEEKKYISTNTKTNC